MMRAGIPHPHTPGNSHGVCTGGDLFRYVLRHQPICRLSEAKAQWIFQQLVIGLDYCHRRVCSAALPREEKVCWCTASQLAMMFQHSTFLSLVKFSGCVKSTQFVYFVFSQLPVFM